MSVDMTRTFKRKGQVSLTYTVPPPRTTSPSPVVPCATPIFTSKYIYIWSHLYKIIILTLILTNWTNFKVYSFIKKNSEKREKLNIKIKYDLYFDLIFYLIFFFNLQKDPKYFLG